MEVAKRLDVLFTDMLSLDIEVATRHYAPQSDAAWRLPLPIGDHPPMLTEC